MHTIKSYLKFLLKSSNQHGVHSPFVYNLVTRCFYDKQKYPQYHSLNKKQKLLFRIINYFQPKTIFEVCDTSVLKTYNLQPAAHNSSETVAFDFIYFQKPTLERFEELLPTRTNDSVWVIDTIHKNPENDQIWQKIKQNETVTVTVDTFVFGLVFFRKEQEKQHFTIRF